MFNLFFSTLSFHVLSPLQLCAIITANVLSSRTKEPETLSEHLTHRPTSTRNSSHSLLAFCSSPVSHSPKALSHPALSVPPSLPYTFITCVNRIHLLTLLYSQQSCLGGTSSVPTSCSSTDVACICKNNSFVSGISCCVRNKCSGSDIQAAIGYAQQLCAGAGVTIATTVPASCSGGISTSMPSSPARNCNVCDDIVEYHVYFDERDVDSGSGYSRCYREEVRCYGCGCDGSGGCRSSLGEMLPKR